MGSGNSVPQTTVIEGKLLDLQAKMRNYYEQKRKAKISYGMIKALVTIAIFSVFIQAIALSYWSYKTDSFIITVKREALIILVSILILQGISLFYSINSRNLSLKIEQTRLQINQLLQQYNKAADIDNLQKALKKAGKDIKIPEVFAASADTFGAIQNKSQSNSIFSRIIQAIVGDGPDRYYALICPMCHTHNGIIDPNEIPKIEYICPVCKYNVRFNERVPIVKEKPYVVDDAPVFDIPQPPDSEDED